MLILLLFFLSSSSATTFSVDLTIIERIRACGERLRAEINDNENVRIPKICYSNPDASQQGTDLQTSRNLARAKRSNLIFRGHQPSCSKPCQRSSLFMDPNVSKKSRSENNFIISSFFDFISASKFITTMAQNILISAAAVEIVRLTSNHCKFTTALA